MIKQRDYNYILDQLFLNSVKFSQKYKSDSIFSIIIYLYTQQLVVFQILIS